MNRHQSLLFSITTAVMALSSCSFAGDEDRARVTAIEDGIVTIKPIGTNLNYASATMRSAIAKGLVGLDEQGRVVPAIAARWIVTDDGLSYIFRLNDAKWNDGRQITSERIAKVLKERIAELRKSRLGGDLTVVDKVISMTGRVIEIRLKTPHPNFLQLLAQPELGLFRAGHGAGPMASISAENQIMVLGILPENTGSEAELDEQEKDPRRVTLRSESASKAIARYAAGQTDIILNGKYHHLPIVEGAGLNSDDLRLDPVAGLFGLRFVRADGFWASPKSREILSMAIDRPALLTSFPSVSAWQSRKKIIPEALDVEGIVTWPDWSSMTMQDRLEFTSDYVQRWKQINGNIETLTIAIPDAAGADILFARIRSDMRRVGLDAVKADMNDKADVQLIDEIAPYDSAQWFLSRFTCDQTPVCSDRADNLIKAGKETASLPTKARYFAQAERELVQHYSYIPLGVPVRWSIVRPNQRGFAVNPRGWHPLNPLVGIPIS